MEWRKVPGWPCYSVSDLGDVRRDKSGRILAGGKDKDGYRQAEKATGVKYTRISSACHHHQKTAGGYHWEFFKEDLY